MPNPSHPHSAPVLTTVASKFDDPTLELVHAIVQAADERKGGDLIVLRVGDVSPLADYFVIITGYSKVQVRAIGRSIEDKVEEMFQRRPVRKEGLTEGTWVLEDYGDVVVHILMPHEREFYNLEAFWGHAEQLDVASLLG
jgi:ribosome-associated protein